MSDNTSDIQSCLEYLEKHVEDDEEVEIILYLEEEEDSVNSGTHHENAGEVMQDVPTDDDIDVDQLEECTEFMDGEALPKTTLSKEGTQNISTSKSTFNSRKSRSDCGKTLSTKKHNTKISRLTTDGDQTERNMDDRDDADYPDQTNKNDNFNYAETEAEIKDMSPPKPLGRYQCMVCPYNTDKKHLLRKHLRTHSDKRPYKCSVCEKAFKYKNYLTEHINTHMNIKPFQCIVCAKTFVSSSKLGRHRKLYHTGMEPIKCTECDYSTLNAVSLKRHKSIHMNERPYQCSQCTYTSTTETNLKRHIRVHTGEKRYECYICHSRFREANLLRYHRETHFTNGKNVFQCNRCPTKLRTQANLRVHMQQQHNALIPNKPHTCPHCERSFTLKGYLLRHMETHAPNSKLNQVKLKSNMRRTTRGRTNRTLASKLKMINEELEADEESEESEQSLDNEEVDKDSIEMEEESKLNQQKLKSNVRRTTRVRSDGTLVSKLKMVNEEIEGDEESVEYEEENVDSVNI